MLDEEEEPAGKVVGGEGAPKERLLLFAAAPLPLNVKDEVDPLPKPIVPNPTLFPLLLLLLLLERFEKVGREEPKILLDWSTFGSGFPKPTMLLLLLLLLLLILLLLSDFPNIGTFEKGPLLFGGEGGIAGGGT